MTKEQEEAIEYLENKIKDVKPEYIETYVDGKLIRSETISLKMRFDKEDADKMETVLNMLKEKDKEIEKKDKIIDLMAEEIKERKYVFTNKTKKDIKQYFERKSENEN